MKMYFPVDPCPRNFITEVMLMCVLVVEKYVYVAESSNIETGNSLGSFRKQCLEALNP